MGDLVLIQAPKVYIQSTYARMIDILENTFSNFSTIVKRANNANFQVFTSTTTTHNVTTGETTLISYIMQPNVMALDGYSVTIKAWGTFAGNANNKEVKLYFGSTIIYDTGAHAVNSGTWYISATVIRTGSATEQSIASITSSNSTIASTASYTTPTETLGSAVTIKCTGTGTATSDIVQNGMIIGVNPYNAN
jgi:hypothetical protein